jgi:hypothetical protein
MDTEFLGAGLLRVSDIFEPGDVITVAQSGPDRVALSSTDEYEYTGRTIP